MHTDMIAIFDIDGTVIDTQSAEGECYEKALLEVTGVALETLDWSTYEDATSSGIFREVIGLRPDRDALEQQFEARFVELLKEAHPIFPADFEPIEGAVAFLEILTAEGIDIAFATGGYCTEAKFKLACCGIDIDDYPHATSSDTPFRAEIIRVAAKRAGIPLSSSVYFADGTWDVKATQSLGVPMIGIGRKIEALKELQVPTRFRDYSSKDSILESVKKLANTAISDLP